MLLAEVQVPFAIVGNVSTCEVEHIGDSSSIEPKGLIKALFYDAHAVSALSDSVEEHSHRTWNQGQIVCVVCKPEQGTVIGFFRKRLAPIEQFNWAEELCKKVNAAWK